MISGEATNYAHPDHLSVRLLTDGGGNSVGQQAHYPFGESWYSQNSTTKWQFTSYELDSEPLNDYAIERTYVNRLGRFSSVDVFGGNLADPQSLNRYVYVLNQPTLFLDPLGLTCYQNVTNDDGTTGVSDTILQDDNADDCDSDGGTWLANTTTVIVNGDDSGGGDGSGSPPGGCAFYYVDGSYTGSSCDGVFVPDLTRQQKASLTLELAGAEATHDLGCVAIPGAGMVAGSAAFQLGQPVPGSKPFVTPGSSVGTSPASEILRDALPQTSPFGIPTPVGGPGTGTPFRIATTTSVGGAAARYLPFAGAAAVGYSTYKLNQCLSSKPQ